jgi:FkbM family methyltransferase
LWGALKDNVLLREYERAGFGLSSVDNVVVDAGAHVGLFTLSISSHASHVIAIEPSHRNLQLLELNLSSNSINNVTVIGGALWSHGHGASFSDVPSTGGGFVGDHRAGRRVPTVTLNDLVRRYGDIQLLKLDVEGAEFDILAAASDSSLDHVSRIVAEIHLEGDPQPFRSLLSRLQRRGWKTSVLRPPVFDWQTSMRQLLRNWRSLEDHTRLKVTVATTYTVLAFADAFVGLRKRLEGGNRLFLHAVRSQQPIASDVLAGRR